MNATLTGRMRSAALGFAITVLMLLASPGITWADDPQEGTPGIAMEGTRKGPADAAVSMVTFADYK